MHETQADPGIVENAAPARISKGQTESISQSTAKKTLLAGPCYFSCEGLVVPG